MDELAQLQVADLRNHHCQKRVRRNVERHAQKGVGAALVELARQAAVAHVELKKRVAGRQSHMVDVGHVPGAHNQAARVGVGLYVVDEFADLVDMRAVGCGPRAPLIAIDVAKVAILVGPLVPDSYTVVLQVFNVGVARQKPQQFVNNRFQVQFFRRQAGESRVQVEAHLVAEGADGARSSAVAFLVARRNNVRQHIEILFHCVAIFLSAQFNQPPLISANLPSRCY